MTQSLNKKGSMRDIIFIAVALFALSIGSFGLYFAANLSYDKMLSVGTINESNATVEVLQSAKATSNKADYVLFMTFIGFAMALIITGWVIGGSYVFMVIYFLFIVISVILSMILSNSWETVTGMIVFGTTISNFPLMDHIISYLPVYISIIGVLGMIAMFGRPLVSKE